MSDLEELLQFISGYFKEFPTLKMGKEDIVRIIFVAHEYNLLCCAQKHFEMELIKLCKYLLKFGLYG